jgi:hypothetical protein
MALFIALSVVGFILISILWFTQRVYLNNLLEVGRKKRTEQMEENNDAQLELTRQGLDPYVNTKSTILNYVYIGIFIAALLTAWVLFFVYALGGQISV